MHQYPMTMGNLRYLCDRLQGASLVVSVHYRDQDGAWLDRVGELVRVDAAVAVDRQDGQPKAIKTGNPLPGLAPEIG